MIFNLERTLQKCCSAFRASSILSYVQLASYPAGTSDWANAEVEKEMELIMEIVKCLRSTRTSYGLTNKQKTAVYVLCQNAATAQTVTNGMSTVFSDA